MCYIFVHVKFYSVPLTRAQIHEMQSESLFQVAAGGLSLKPSHYDGLFYHSNHDP